MRCASALVFEEPLSTYRMCRWGVLVMGMRCTSNAGRHGIRRRGQGHQASRLPRLLRQPRGGLRGLRSKWTLIDVGEK